MPVATFLTAALIALHGAQIHTTLHVFTPWAGSIPAAGVTTDKTLRGSCTGGSRVLTRADAWHCTAGGRTYDPCFSNSRAEVGAHVLCMASPWEDATAIELTARLPLNHAKPGGKAERSRPWAMVTAAHQECDLVPDSSMGRVAGLPVDYACAGSGLLLGVPTRGTTWTQAYAAAAGVKKTSRVALRSVWW